LLKFWLVFSSESFLDCLFFLGWTFFKAFQHRNVSLSNHLFPWLTFFILSLRCDVGEMIFFAWKIYRVARIQSAFFGNKRDTQFFSNWSLISTHKIRRKKGWVTQNHFLRSYKYVFIVPQVGAGQVRHNKDVFVQIVLELISQEPLKIKT